MTHLTAAYMAIGLITAPNTLQVQDKWGRGQLGMLNILTNYAGFSSRLSDAGFRIVGGMPGVVQYEVDAEFGEWFGHQILAHEDGHDPKREDCEQCLRCSMYDFYKQGCVAGTAGDTLRARLASALAAVDIEDPA